MSRLLAAAVVVLSVGYGCTRGGFTASGIDSTGHAGDFTRYDGSPDAPVIGQPDGTLDGTRAEGLIVDSAEVPEDLCAPLVLDNPCLIDLSMCGESQKASAWQGMTSLTGTVIFAGYLGTSGLMCSADTVGQAWPVVTEPSWWCGVVKPVCE